VGLLSDGLEALHAIVADDCGALGSRVDCEPIAGLESEVAIEGVKDDARGHILRRAQWS